MPSEKCPSTVEQRFEQFFQKYLQADLSGIEYSRLAGDASARQYYRCILPDKRSYVLVAYPEPFGTEGFAYRQVYDLFREIGIPVPTIVALDGPLGLVLQEDLGDELLLERMIQEGLVQQENWMRKAVDYVLKLQVEGSSAVKPGCVGYELAFDREKFVWELRYFHKYYLGRTGKKGGRDEDSLQEEYDRLSTELAGYPRVFCHRDFHVRNLIVKDDVLYVIDFQDARWGPPAYDLVSLLKDSLELDRRTSDALQAYYLDKIRQRRPSGVLPDIFVEERFNRQFHLTSVQRLLKALGTYGYQTSILNKTSYLKYIEGTLRRVYLSLQELHEFPAIASMVERQLSRVDAGHWNDETRE